uniref:Secreted protein n=1 Tax=Haemonchus placei TaxID=6290 RepID=A0A0N4WEQ1_HAEPC
LFFKRTLTVSRSTSSITFTAGFFFFRSEGLGMRGISSLLSSLKCFRRLAGRFGPGTGFLLPSITGVFGGSGESFVTDPFEGRGLGMGINGERIEIGR